MCIRKLLIFICVCCTLVILSVQGNSVFAAITPSEVNGISFEHYSSADGLSQESVLCIFQDSLGTMWFGTLDGLNKFDGYQFTIYRPDTEARISSLANHILSIIRL